MYYFSKMFFFTFILLIKYSYCLYMMNIGHGVTGSHCGVFGAPLTEVGYCQARQLIDFLKDCEYCTSHILFHVHLYISGITMEVTFTQEKWPCPYKNEISGLGCNPRFDILFEYKVP